MIKLINKLTKNEDIDNICKHVVGVILEKYSVGSDPCFVQTLFTELQSTEIMDVTHLMSKLKFKKQNNLVIVNEIVLLRNKNKKSILINNNTDYGFILKLEIYFFI